jgi:hypothetical protein
MTSRQQEISEHYSRTISDDEKDSTAYLYKRIRDIYGAGAFAFAFPTQQDENNSKREHAEMIGKYDIKQINLGMDFVHQQKQAGEHRYMKIDLDVMIGAIKDANRSRAAHKPHQKRISQRPSKEKGLAATSSIMDMLNE